MRKMLFRNKRRKFDLQAISSYVCLLVCFLVLKFQNPAVTGMCLTTCYPKEIKAIIKEVDIPSEECLTL